MSHVSIVPVKIISSAQRCDLSPQTVTRQFKTLIEQGAEFRGVGKAGERPSLLFARRLMPKHRIEIFDTVFYLTNYRQIPELRFFVAYVVRNENSGTRIYPRIFYKDLSLAWRSASHFTMVDGHIWVGKGDVRIDEKDGFETIESVESTTDLPIEMQTTMESLLDWSRMATNGDGILQLVLRQGAPDRVEPYADFLSPRKRARSNPKNLVNHGRSIARFKRQNDPTSLQITPGYEPDFLDGVIEKGVSYSKLYKGRLSRFRILSKNRLVQYYFIAGPKHVWIIPPQATTTEISSFGVRTIDVVADEKLFVPGYEYHLYEQTPNGRQLYSQIPAGFAGDICPVDESKADASPWLDRIPLIQQFRREIRY